MLTQFVAAFDDSFVYRYTKDGLPKERIDVRYIFGPKDRIIWDIVNQNKQFTLPAVSINQTSISRDVSRNQNKEQYMYRHATKGNNNISRIPQPIPVNISLDVSIITKYKEDIDQIVSNFIPYCNPYFVIAWKVPESYGMDFIDELRSEVTWSGDVSYENPSNLTSQDKYRIIGNTSFTIKGWIFPADTLPQAPIYTVRTDFKVASLENRIYTVEDHDDLDTLQFDTDVVTVSAYPEFTNAFHNTDGAATPLHDNTSIRANQDNHFLLNGKRFIYNNTWYLSSSNTSLSLNYEEVKTARHPLIYAYRLPSEFIKVHSDNTVTVSISANYMVTGSYTIVTANSAGWVRMDTDILVI